MFTISHSDGNARVGKFQTAHGEFNTPAFMPCGTKGAVKTLTPDELKTLGVEILLGNTYHLTLRPGEELIKGQGGLHTWMGWDGPILTDSGGFQVFSLSKMRKINDNGVEFRSHIDGEKKFLTPEKSIDIQLALDSDIVMAFDECATGDSDHSYAKEAMERTHSWLTRSIEQFNSSENAKNRFLFGIIQGVIFDDLRVESAKFVSQQDLPGIAIGGLSVGESKDHMYHSLEILLPHLPNKKPHYLMGVGTPEDILNGVERGIDMFDCVLPTRLARHGTFWNKTGRHHIKNEEYKVQRAPLESGCACYTCSNFSASYLRHLIMESEILGHRLLTIHNLHFLLDLMRNIRKAVAEGHFTKFKREFLATFQK
ncbi:MAG: tRNA guanosine(34) transglycosylase Tgt [Patescibacteria group bacterium]